MGSEHFCKLNFAKIAPRLRARAIRKSKLLKHQVLGTFLEVESAFCVAGAGISTGCKIRGRRRSSWGLQNRWQAWWIWRGSETMRFAWQTQNPWKGCKFHVTEVLLFSDHFAWQLQDFVCLGSTFSWQAQYFWSIHLKIVKTYWNSEVKCLVNMSILKEVSQKCFVFDLQSFIFEGSLAEKLRFWASKRYFWRKSGRIASFLSFNALFLKEVWQKSFVFEGSLAEKLRLTKSFESRISWQPNHLNLKSFDIQITWISNQLTTNSFESQIDWQPNHLNLRSIDNRIIWISNQLTTTSLELQINRQPKSFEARIDWQPNQLNLKSIDNQNHLNLKSDDNQIIWLSTRLNLTSIDFRTNWTPRAPFL